MDFDDAFAAKRQQSVRNKFFDDFVSGAGEPAPTKKLATQEIAASPGGDVDKMLLDFSLDGDAAAANQSKKMGSMPPKDSAAFVPDEHFFRTIANKT